MNVGRKIIAALLVLLVVATTAQAAPPLAEVHKGRMLEVHDGDTPRVMIKSVLAGDAVRWLRLADGVDCPESRQPWGDVARRRTLELVQDQALVIELTGAATYGRPVARVWLPDGRELGALLVVEGLAWVDPRYAKSAHGREMMALMKQAQAERRGLWADGNAVAPWLWRKKKTAPAK